MFDDGYLGPKQHLLLLGCIVLGGLVLKFAPHTVSQLQYQCVLSRLTGIRCPFCGMTRDFILMAHGMLPQNNPGSLIVALGLYVAYPVWAVAGFHGYWSLLVRREKLTNVLLGTTAILFFCNNFVH